MLEQYSHPNNRGRFLRGEEKEILISLLNSTQHSFRQDIDAAIVEDMMDGNMGSIQFLSHSEDSRTFGRILAEAEYTDKDGVPIGIMVICDQKGDLYEMDFWKVDFSPLQQYPKPSQLRIKT